MIDAELKNFISTHQQDDIRRLAFARQRFKLSDEQFLFALQQIEGRQLSIRKLPTLAQIQDWVFPKKISLEQCSSEVTAKYKLSLIKNCFHTPSLLIDLTGGFGVDTYFLSSAFTKTIYVEQQKQLCELAQHNFSLSDREISIVNDDSINFIKSYSGHIDCIYVDPARRDINGRKVFRLEDLQPNVVEHFAEFSKCQLLMLKLSPMLDIQSALNSLPNCCREVHIVSVNNEVKELLMLYSPQLMQCSEPKVVAVNLETQQPTFSFAFSEEHQAVALYATELDDYVYEPNMAIMKAGAYKMVAEKYDIKKLARNSHLYTSDRFLSDFPGRVYRVVELANKKLLKGGRFNVVSRNYPLSAELIAKKYQIKSGNLYLIATKIGDEPLMFIAERQI